MKVLIVGSGGREHAIAWKMCIRDSSSGEFQDRMIDGRPLYEWVGEKVAQWGEEHMGDSYSYVGAVVGATYPEMGKVLRKVKMCIRDRKLLCCQFCNIYRYYRTGQNCRSILLL